jgi:secreted trypsin-like serine protease
MHFFFVILGDSGGPLVRIKDNLKHFDDVLMGIASFGHFCEDNIPAVYTKVPSVVAWIKRTAREIHANATEMMHQSTTSEQTSTTTTPSFESHEIPKFE